MRSKHKEWQVSLETKNQVVSSNEWPRYIKAMVLERSRIEQPMTHGRNGSVIRSCARTSFRGIPTKRDMTSFGSVGGSHWIKVVPWMVLKSYGICFNGLEERLREFSFLTIHTPLLKVHWFLHSQEASANLCGKSIQIGSVFFGKFVHLCPRPNASAVLKPWYW